MITVTVQGYLTFKELVGKTQISIPEGSSLLDSLLSLRRELGRRFAEEAFNGTGELSGHTLVLLNGMHYRHLPGGLGTILKDGDQVAIFPPLAGG